MPDASEAEEVPAQPDRSHATHRPLAAIGTLDQKPEQKRGPPFGLAMLISRVLFP
jgi:hypothetical protein